MDTDQLRAFERIVREGSFSKAARTLAIAQPTISARIQALEQTVGGLLFLRSSRKLILTEHGESFLPYARRALAVLDEGIMAAQLTQKGMRGRVTIGTIRSLATGLLTSTVAHFHATHPQVDLCIETGHSDQVAEMLDDGVVKLGLLTWPYVNIELTPLLRFQEPLVLVVSASHPLAQQTGLTLTEVIREAKPLWIIKWTTQQALEFSHQVSKQGAVLEVPSSLAYDLVLRGDGAGFFPHALIADSLRAKHLVEVILVDRPQLFRESALVRMPRGDEFAGAMADFIAALRREGNQRGLLLEEPSGREKKSRVLGSAFFQSSNEYHSAR